MSLRDNLRAKGAKRAKREKWGERGTTPSSILPLCGGGGRVGEGAELPRKRSSAP